MRVSFSNVTTARAARDVFEAYGYPAQQLGCEVVTDCPTLLALPALEKRVGLAAVERLDLGAGRAPGDQRAGRAQGAPAMSPRADVLPADLPPNEPVLRRPPASRCGAS